jgi:hypothetical protein
LLGTERAFITSSELRILGLVEWLCFDTVFHPIAGTFNYDRFGVMKKAIEDGGSNGAITVEDSGPLFEGFVRGDDDGTAFVSLADDLEKQVGSALIYRQVADLAVVTRGGFTLNETGQVIDVAPVLGIAFSGKGPAIFFEVR